MQLKDVAFAIVDWPAQPVTRTDGESGYAEQRLYEAGNVRVRQVSYSAGYCADHWCERGHVLLVLDGALRVELKDGRSYTMAPGHSFQVADGPPSHRVSTKAGCTVFIVD